MDRAALANDRLPRRQLRRERVRHRPGLSSLCEHDPREGRFAILGIFPDDIVRNVNQYRAFIGFGAEPFLVRGRFILDARGTRWLARPSLDEQRYLELHENPCGVLPHEYLIPNTRDGQVAIGFPYALVLTRLAMAPRLWNRLRGRTPWSDFYRAEHPRAPCR